MPIINDHSIFREEERPTNVHEIPDAGTREGISFQSVPDAAKTHRDRTRSLSNREADQDLVPEPSHEMEEGEQDQRRGWFRRRWR